MLFYRELVSKHLWDVQDVWLSWELSHLRGYCIKPGMIWNRMEWVRMDMFFSVRVNLLFLWHHPYELFTSHDQNGRLWDQNNLHHNFATQLFHSISFKSTPFQSVPFFTQCNLGAFISMLKNKINLDVWPKSHRCVSTNMPKKVRVARLGILFIFCQLFICWFQGEIVSWGLLLTKFLYNLSIMENKACTKRHTT